MLAGYFPQRAAVGTLLCHHQWSTVALWRKKPMMTTATHNEHGTTPARVLFMAFELSQRFPASKVLCSFTTPPRRPASYLKRPVGFCPEAAHPEY